MFPNTAAEIRPDLQAVVMDAAASEQYFIASKVFPSWGSPTKNGEYRRIKKGSGHLLFKPGEDYLLRAPKAPYKEVDRTYEKDGFLCKDRGLTEVIDDSTEHDQARFFSAQAVASRAVLSSILRAFEARVASLVMNKSIWGSLEVETPWTAENADTIKVDVVMKALIRQFTRRQEIPNTIVMAKELFDFVTSTKLLGQYFFGPLGGGRQITPQMFAEAFGFSQILLPEAVYSSAKNGKEPTDEELHYIWRSDYIWIGTVKGGDPEEGGAGRNIYWEEDAESEYVVETYRDEDRRSDVVRVRQNSVEKVINENCGLILDTGYTGDVE